jgi:hypothetical protein
MSLIRIFPQLYVLLRKTTLNKYWYKSKVVWYNLIIAGVVVGTEVFNIARLAGLTPDDINNIAGGLAAAGTTLLLFKKEDLRAIEENKRQRRAKSNRIIENDCPNQATRLNSNSSDEKPPQDSQVKVNNKLSEALKNPKTNPDDNYKVVIKNKPDTVTVKGGKLLQEKKSNQYPQYYNNKHDFYYDDDPNHKIS